MRKTPKMKVINPLSQIKKTEKGKGVRLMGRELSLRKTTGDLGRKHPRMQHISLPATSITRKPQAQPAGI